MTTADLFLRGDQWVGIISSNVAMACWHKARRQLEIEYLDGSRYLYPADCDERKARSFITSESKGSWRHQHYPRGTPGVVQTRKSNRTPRGR